MFKQNGMPLAVDPFQIKHIIVAEHNKALTSYDDVYKYRMVEKYFIDSYLYHYNVPIHRLSRYSIDNSDIGDFKGTLKNPNITQLLDAQVKPPVHECYAILAFHKGKEKLKRFFA